mgnify:CR=1 FL=1
MLVGYWSRLRKGRSLPDQTDIDPRAIKRILSHVFILEAGDTSRPVYRLAGTSVCERFGTELKGTDFLTHWEGESRGALSALLRQSLMTRQPVCIFSIGSTMDCGMAELETVLAPVTFGDTAPRRFIGMVQVMSDMAQLGGKPISFERLVGAQLIRESEPLSSIDVPPPPMPPGDTYGSHPKAPHLRLVVNRSTTLHCEMDETMKDLIRALDIVTQPVARLVR